jgi:hypothetical protein
MMPVPAVTDPLPPPPVSPEITIVPLNAGAQVNTTSPVPLRVYWQATAFAGDALSKQNATGAVPCPCVAAETVNVVCEVTDDEYGGVPPPPPVPRATHAGDALDSMQSYTVSGDVSVLIARCPIFAAVQSPPVGVPA